MKISSLIPGKRYEISAPLWPPAGVERVAAILARDVPPTGWRITITDGLDDIRRWTIESESAVDLGERLPVVDFGIAVQ